jgi:hypothetical protein
MADIDISLLGEAIGIAYEAEPDKNAYTDADKAKVDFITVTGAVDLDAVLALAEDTDIAAIAALTTTAAGRSILTAADPNADRMLAWDDSGGIMGPIALADITTEAAPATGDYLIAYTAEGGLVKVDYAAIDAKQPLDSDLTAIAALTTTAAGRSVLTVADPNADRIVAWDDSAGAMAAIALADVTTEAAPATGDYLLAYTAEGGLVKVDYAAIDAKQPLDSDLTAIAALTTTAAGRSALAIADPNADRMLAWDDSAGAVAPIALADITIEAAPASGDYLIAYTAEGALVRVNWTAILAYQPLLAAQTESGASVDLTNSMNGKVIRLTHATPVLNIRTNATHALSADFSVLIVAVNAEATLDAAAGVTLNGSDGANLSLPVRPASAMLYRSAADTFDVVGGLD